jgi:hypothetical protein
MLELFVAGTTTATAASAAVTAAAVLSCSAAVILFLFYGATCHIFNATVDDGLELAKMAAMLVIQVAHWRRWNGTESTCSGRFRAYRSACRIGGRAIHDGLAGRHGSAHLNAGAQMGDKLGRVTIVNQNGRVMG